MVQDFREASSREQAQAPVPLLWSSRCYLDVTAVAFSPDGHWLVSGSCDQTLRVWEAGTGRLVHVFYEPRHIDRYSGCPDSLAFHPAADLFGYANPNLQACFRRSDTWEEVQLLEESPEATSLTFSPAGNQLAIAHFEQLSLWDVWGRAPLHFIDLRYGCTALAFSPDGVTLAVATLDPAIRLLDVATGTFVGRLCGHCQDIDAVIYSADGQVLASHSVDGQIRLWNTETWALLGELRAAEGYTKALAFVPGGRVLTGADTEGQIRFWDVRQSEERGTLAGHRTWVYAVCYSADGSRLAAGSMDCTVRVWDTSSFAATVSRPG